MDGLTSKRNFYYDVTENAKFTVGGGVGFCAPALFRIATENTIMGAPETKIGYPPAYGATYIFNQLDGELGTYLSLTGENLRGRAV